MKNGPKQEVETEEVHAQNALLWYSLSAPQYMLELFACVTEI
jgi:hypothetical protein